MTRKSRPFTASLLYLLVATALAPADDAPRPDSPMVKMLKAGRVPDDRQGTVFDMIGKRGNVADLGYLFDRALQPAALTLPNRLKALAALGEAAQTRGLRPEAELARLTPLLAADDPASALAAARLAGLWKAAPLVEPLAKLAASPGATPALRAAACDALAAIGGPPGLQAISTLAGPKQPPAVRLPAVAALARLDPDQAAATAAALLRDGAVVGEDLNPLIAAFLNQQGGSDRLAAALQKAALPADAAKLALRSVYALGRSDAGLVSALSKAAGLDAEPRPLDKPAMDSFLAAVASEGDPARGETVFRRADLNCVKCHAVSGAGGAIGPDLSPVGATSPVDYLVNSILLPDQAIKEVYQTLVVLTTDGQVFHGIVEDRDAQKIVLREATGDRRVIATSAVEESKEGGSLMPKGLANFLTRAELVDLVRFLSELGKPGPYAVRNAPTVQRWRALKDVPPPLAAATPDPETFEAEVLKAPESRWQSAYARVAGDLPLAEAVALAHAPVVYLQGEVDLSHADRLALKLDSAAGVTAWWDATPLNLAGDRATLDPKPGRHALTLRVDTGARPTPTLRAEFVKPPGSSAEFVVVGGK